MHRNSKTTLLTIKNYNLMETKLFKIAFVLENGKLLFYGFTKFPFLTFEINAGYDFRTEVYKTTEMAIAEAEHLKEFFFGKNNKIKAILIHK